MTREQLYQYVVPTEYHCHNHTPGEVFTVRLKGEAIGNPGWFYVENIHTGDEFPVQIYELTSAIVENINEEELLQTERSFDNDGYDIWGYDLARNYDPLHDRKPCDYNPFIPRDQQ